MWHRVGSRSCFNTAQFWAEPGEDSATYRWTFSGLKPGEYLVSIWVPDDPNSDHTSTAHYTIRSGSHEYMATADQSKDFQTWRPLGTFTLAADGYIDLDNSGGKRVVADAVLLTPAS